MSKGRVRNFLLLIAVIAAVVLALQAASASANSPSASVSFAGNATLVTGGVNVPMHYSCAAPNPGSLLVIIDENGVQGFNTVPANCDGQNHSVTVTVAGAFTPGTATGQAQVANADFSSVATDFGSKVAIK